MFRGVSLRFDDLADLGRQVDLDVVRVRRDHQVAQVRALLDELLQRPSDAKQLAGVEDLVAEDREVHLPRDPAGAGVTRHVDHHEQIRRHVNVVLDALEDRRHDGAGPRVGAHRPDSPTTGVEEGVHAEGVLDALDGGVADLVHLTCPRRAEVESVAVEDHAKT